MHKKFQKGWTLERNYTYTIRKNKLLCILDYIVCIGTLTEIERPTGEILSTYPFLRFFNKWNFIFWYCARSNKNATDI